MALLNSYVKVNGAQCYLYRAIDRDGNLVDARLSPTRDMDAARQFLQQALAIAGEAPERVTTDGYTAYPRAIREMLGGAVTHRTSRYKNNRLEQDHRGIKQRYYPMHGFGNFVSASRFCTGFEEQRQYFRPRTTQYEQISLAEQRHRFQNRWAAVLTKPRHDLSALAAFR